MIFPNNPNPDLIEANKALIKNLNALKTFYRTYPAYLGGNFSDLCQNIDSNEPNISLRSCAELVQNAIKQGEGLAGIERIYVLIDEYDAFPNIYLESKVVWEDTTVGQAFKFFWATIKSLGAEGMIRRIFITCISPLSLSSVGSAFNVVRNLSFHKDLTGLSGLTYSDFEDALKSIYEDSEAYSSFLSEMTKYFNGYHFCQDETVEIVCNTGMCLLYLQCRMEAVAPRIQDPENSVASEQILMRFEALASVIRDLKNVLKRDETGSVTLAYGQFKSEYTLQDLVYQYLNPSPRLC